MAPSIRLKTVFPSGTYKPTDFVYTRYILIPGNLVPLPTRIIPMPRLISQLIGNQWDTEGPATPVQRFFEQCVSTVDAHGSNFGSAPDFYSKNAVFHNQNSAIYRGADKMRTWIKQLFADFERIARDVVSLLEIERDDGTTQVVSQEYVICNKSNDPTVSIPMALIAIIGRENDGKSPKGLQFKEVWLYWDTALLSKYLPQDAVVFQTENILHQ